MGITGELVRSVFSRNRSGESHARSSASEKKRWSAVRVYLCGDEFNSVLAEEDSASVKSSEATVTQPLLEDAASQGESEYEETEDSLPNEKYNSTSRLFQQEDAATIIQTAFRNFLARRRREEEKELKDEMQEPNMGTESPSRESVGTSLEVQTGNSVEVLSVKQENLAAHLRMQKKAKAQVLKIKEDWDDSTVSSNESKMRIQNRLEATNRRERALAYAFAQQLRICSRRKQTRSDGTEPNMGWSWLERWMATRLPEYSVESRTSKPFDPLNSNQKNTECSVESRTSKQYDPSNSNQNVAARMRFFDTAEEKESCGSNEVSAQFDSISTTETKDNDKPKTHKHQLKPTRTISRRKTVPSCQCPKDNSKLIKESQKESEQEEEHRLKQSNSKKQIEPKNSS